MPKISVPIIKIIQGRHEILIETHILNSRDQWRKHLFIYLFTLPLQALQKRVLHEGGDTVINKLDTFQQKVLYNKKKR